MFILNDSSNAFHLYQIVQKKKKKNNISTF